MTDDYLTTHRQERFRVQLLDLQDRPVGELGEVEGGQIDYSIDDEIKSGGNIDVVISDPSAVDWLKVRLKVYYSLWTPQDVLIKEWPMGVFIPSAPVGTYTDTEESRQLEIFDKLLILQDDKLLKSYTVKKGANPITAVKTLLTGTGETNMSITTTADTLDADMVWEAGETKLKVINDLLDAANYWPIWCNPNGQFQVKPHTTPAQRSIKYVFTEGEASIYLPTVKVDNDYHSVPNKYVLISRSEGTTKSRTSTATNTSATSRFSYANRGRWIVKVDKDVEATTQAKLDKLAQRRLDEATEAAQRINIEHAWIPLELNDIVQFSNARAQLFGVYCSVKSMQVSMVAGGLVKTVLQEVQR